MDTLLQLLRLQGAAFLVMAVTFAVWFRVRHRRGADLACVVVAHLAVAALGLPQLLLGKLGGMALITALPGLVLYFWFMALWSARRHRSRILSWGRTNGYQVTRIDLEPTLGDRFKTEYRLVARRPADGQILTGRAVFTAGRLEMFWAAAPGSK